MQFVYFYTLRIPVGKYLICYAVCLNLCKVRFTLSVILLMNVAVRDVTLT
jgi:hypothetical protein